MIKDDRDIVIKTCSDNIKNRHLFSSFSVQTYIDTYKYIEVKKSVFLKYKVQIVQVHSIITKTETEHNIQVIFAFFTDTVQYCTL